MAVQNFLRDLDGLFNYSTDENPTSQQDYQEAVKNWVDTVKSLVDCTLWQPDTEYAAGNVLRTPSLPYELQLTCITAGTSGSAEPDYTDVSLGDTITDGTVTWLVDGYLPLSGGTMTGAISFDTTGQIGYRATTHTEPAAVCKQVVVTAGTVDSAWNDGNAKLCLHTYDSTGTNTAEDGGFALQTSDGTNAPYLEGKPNGSLKWANHNVMTEKTETGTITATRGTLTGGTLRKRGNIVELSFEVSSVGAGAKAWTTFLNIPDGFRPIDAFDFPIIDNSTGWSVQGKITSSGDLSVWPPSTTISTVRGHVVYFV